jgi:lipid-binding SYLF domain-containing protein
MEMELICPDCNGRFSASAETTEEDIVQQMTEEGPWYALAAGNCFRDMIHTALRRRGGIACPECGALVRVQAVDAVETTTERMPSTMTKLSRLFLLVSLVWLLDAGATLRAEGREIAILEGANTALSKFVAMPANRIFPFNRVMMALLRNAQGIAIFPGMFKAAVGIGGRHGRGVLLIREADGSWGPPLFLKLSGASAGIQLGIERTDLVLAFRTRSDLERLKQGKLTLGVDNMLAVGPWGVEHVLGTDAGLRTCILSPSSPCRGLYAGWSVEGNVLQIDAAANAAYDQYQQNCLRSADPRGTGVPPPSLRLQMKLAELSAPLPTQNVVTPSSSDPPLPPQP